jgi:hypothetical protein
MILREYQRFRKNLSETDPGKGTVWKNYFPEN